MNLVFRSKLYLALSIAAAGLTGSGFAQNGNPPPQSQGGQNAAGKRTPSIDMRPVVIPDVAASSTEVTRPQRPGTAMTPQDVADAIKIIQADRQNYLKNSRALARINQDSQAEDRAAVREQMRENIQRIRDHQKALRKEFKDRVDEMKAELSPDFGRVFAQVAVEGRAR